MNTTQVYIPDESLSPHLYIGVNRLSTPAVSITVPTAPFHEGQAGPYHPWRQFLFRPNFFSNLHERSSGSRFRAISTMYQHYRNFTTVSVSTLVLHRLKH